MGQAGAYIIDEKDQMRKKKGEGWSVVRSGGGITDISVGHQTVWVVTKHQRIYRWKSGWKKMPGSLTNVSRHIEKGAQSKQSKEKIVDFLQRGGVNFKKNSQ